MNLRIDIRIFIEIYVLLNIIFSANTSRVRNAKIRIRQEIRHELNSDLPTNSDSINFRHGISRNPRNSFRLHNSGQWHQRRKLSDNTYTQWSQWSKCDNSCVKRRERFCRIRRKCGNTKHIEEQMCQRCLFHPTLSSPLIDSSHYPSSSAFSNNENNHFRLPIPVYKEIDEEPKHDEQLSDFYVIKKRTKKRRKKKQMPIVIEIEDYEDLEEEEDDPNDSISFDKKLIKSIRSKNWLRDNDYDIKYQRHKAKKSRKGRKYLKSNSDEFDFDDTDIFEDRNDYINIPNEYDYNYEEEYDGQNRFDSQYKNTTRSSPREKAVIEVPRFKRIYSKWSKWTKCSAKCTTRRYKKCRMKEICGKEVLREIAYCYTEGSFCQQWLQTQVQKNHSYNVKPLASSRKDVVSTNSIANDYVVSGKGYRGPEYTPMKLKCGIPSIRNNKKSISNLLKIIGGKASKKGEWPWQVVIFNRFKEAFCGGTLIAPQWILTAAHCVRKVLYVRLGEHNLDVDEGTEIEFRVAKTFKHPSFDKTTVDSDVALLKLPRPVNTSTWIGFSCMPRPYQPLPKNIQCTVIGWGKRRNRDQAGTSILHQAEVPIISMDHCKLVYYDYKITKNMFCAGHKRGRIDTCAGDSGGPLLCRDTTKPNHPWTIFGITSFGDGCAKKNKFGIYAKVPNYVDWVWSVVNCNGNCKTRKRT